MRTGTAKVPLHGGFCPPWLFEKMKQLASVIIEAIVYEYGTAEVMRRLADPVWFQSFGSVVGFDWHSSGLTTVLCGDLKEGLKDRQGELGLFIAGGKGRVARQTPQEIQVVGDKYGLANDLNNLQRVSRLVAKVDSAAVQDGYQLYHHVFIFNAKGNWAVVQQGMNETEGYARRYHWLSEGLRSYVDNPHAGICGRPEANVLNLVCHENLATRTASVELCYEKPAKILNLVKLLREAEPDSKLIGLFDEPPAGCVQTTLIMPRCHFIPSTAYLDKILYKIYERPPENYEKLLETEGVGASTLRALAMVAEITHGAKPTFCDPVRYAFAHGGKDGFPHPVNKEDIARSLEVMRKALTKARLGNQEKLKALRNLAKQERRLEIK